MSHAFDEVCAREELGRGARFTWVALWLSGAQATGASLLVVVGVVGKMGQVDSLRLVLKILIYV